MNVVSMQVLEVKRHPQADTLWIYVAHAPAFGSLELVANSDRTYATGDVIAVARVGTELLDGTVVKKARLRGVDSFGMILGEHRGPVGEDLTSRFAKVPLDGSAPVVKWPSIEGMHHVRHGLMASAADGGPVPPRVAYRAKVKLHGTNAGVQVLASGSIVAQGRTQTLTPQSDNAGFAAWVQRHGDLFASVRGETDMVIFGEWCGPGIQKGVAITAIPRRVLAVFAVQLHTGREQSSLLVVEPDRIRELVPDHPDIFVLPWHGETIDLDWADTNQLESAADAVNEWVAEIEKRDPWVARTFGIEGTGEGLVLYPVRIHGREYDATRPVDRDTCAELMWKAKGDKHKVVRQQKAAQVAPEVASSIDEFIDLFLTEARLEQGLAEACGGDRSPRNTGAFLAWVSADVEKESAVELEASGLAWKQVNKPLTQRARTWFLTSSRKLTAP